MWLCAQYPYEVSGFCSRGGWEINFFNLEKAKEIFWRFLAGAFGFFFSRAHFFRALKPCT